MKTKIIKGKEAPAISKYPYIGFYNGDKNDQPNVNVYVLFESPSTGTVISSTFHKIGFHTSAWGEIALSAPLIKFNYPTIN